MADAFGSTEGLQVVAGNHRSHAESHQCEGGVAADCLVDIRLQFLCKVDEAVLAIGGLKVGAVATVALSRQVLGHAAIHGTFVPDAVNHDDVHAGRLGAFAFFLFVENRINIDRDVGRRIAEVFFGAFEGLGRGEGGIARLVAEDVTPFDVVVEA